MLDLESLIRSGPFQRVVEFVCYVCIVFDAVWLQSVGIWLATGRWWWV